MGGWFYLIVGIVLGVVLTPIVLWVLFKLFVRFFFKKLMSKLEAAAGGGLPQLRLEIDPLDEPEWNNPKRIEGLTAELERHGFQQAGDFTLLLFPQVEARGFANAARSLYAVIYDWPADLAPGLTTVIDLFAQGEGDSPNRPAFTVTNTPESGLDTAPWATKVRVEADPDDPEEMISQFLARMEEVTAGVGLRPVANERFATDFRAGYAREMDWQIERGGPQRDEIIRNLVLTQGLSEDDERIDEVVETTQTPWRYAIADFISQETQERFLRHVTKMSAGEWEDRRDRIFVVHERSMPEILSSTILSTALDADPSLSDDEDDDEYIQRQEELSGRLEPYFDDASPRAAFESAQAVLPEGVRYQRLARIKSPWPADVYLQPELDEDY